MRKIIAILFFLCFIAAAGGYWWFALRLPVVVVALPKRGPAVEVLYATGVVESRNWAKIAPKGNGRITEILADEHDKVVTGQPLMRLDDEEARALLAQAEAGEAYYREELVRQRKLAQSKTVSQGTLDRAINDYLQAEASMMAARRRVEDLTIVSLKDGTVLRRDGEIGEMVGKENVLYWVGQVRPARITADVDEEDIARVRPGQKVLIKADAFPDHVFEGKVERITPVGDTLNKNFRVRIDIADDIPLMLGMSCEINIVVRENPQALLVPGTAVENRQSKQGVFLEKNETVRFSPVQIGATGQGMVEIVSEFDDRSRVLVTPPAGLADGAMVRTKLFP